eukprot:6185235-Pleurochrysis_carterae.AAC.1
MPPLLAQMHGSQALRKCENFALFQYSISATKAYGLKRVGTILRAASSNVISEGTASSADASVALAASRVGSTASRAT